MLVLKPARDQCQAFFAVKLILDEPIPAVKRLGIFRVIELPAPSPLFIEFVAAGSKAKMSSPNT